MRIEKIPAVTLKVASMRNSVRFYKDVLGMEIIFGGEDGSLFFAPRPGRQHRNPESRARSFGSRLGTDDFLRGGCGCVLGST